MAPTIYTSVPTILGRSQSTPVKSQPVKTISRPAAMEGSRKAFNHLLGRHAWAAGDGAGSKFFYKTNGSEFFVRGAAYQQNGYFATYSSSIAIIDPFEDGPTCARDIPYLVDASINTVRAYAVLPTIDHSACMNELANAGIYALIDLTGNQVDQKINTTSPGWNYQLYDQMTSVVDAFHNFTNVLGFSVGNEVVNDTATQAAPFVKAAIRDVKAYIKAKNYRDIPIGYTAADDSGTLQDTAAYLNCGQAAHTADFLGLNLYSWCGDSTLTESGYSDRISEFQNYSVPVFLSEYGCNIPSPRKFNEVQAIYSDEMSSVFSGGIVYQYFKDNANYRLVSVYGDSVSTSADYSYFSQQMATATPSRVNSKSYSATNSQQECPTTDTIWMAAPTLPPVPYARLCSCMMHTLTCVASDSINTTAVGNIVQEVCGTDVSLCAALATDSATGTFGAYSVCNATELTSWVLNGWYISQNNDSSACTGLGGTIQKPVAASSQASDCTILLQQAGVSGTGTITSTPSPPAAAVTDNSDSGSNAGSSNNNTGLTQTTNNGSSGGGSGISAGAIAGIVIGAIAALAIIAVLSFFLWRARRKNRAAVISEKDADRPAKAELPADEGRRQEADGNPRLEADGQPLTSGGVIEYYKAHPTANGPPAELQGNLHDPVELPAPHGVTEAGLRSPIGTVNDT